MVARYPVAKSIQNGKKNYRKILISIIPNTFKPIQFNRSDNKKFR